MGRASVSSRCVFDARRVLPTARAPLRPVQVLSEQERRVEYDAYLVATAALHRKISFGSILATKEPPLELQARAGGGGVACRRGSITDYTPTCAQAIPGMTQLLHHNVVHEDSTLATLEAAAHPGTGDYTGAASPEVGGDEYDAHDFSESQDLNASGVRESRAASIVAAAAPAAAVPLLTSAALPITGEPKGGAAAASDSGR